MRNFERGFAAVFSAAALHKEAAALSENLLGAMPLIAGAPAALHGLSKHDNAGGAVGAGLGATVGGYLGVAAPVVLSAQNINAADLHGPTLRGSTPLGKVYAGLQIAGLLGGGVAGAHLGGRAGAGVQNMLSRGRTHEE